MKVYEMKGRLSYALACLMAFGCIHFAWMSGKKYGVQILADCAANGTDDFKKTYDDFLKTISEKN